MPVSDPTAHDVIIAGAGPVGLFLACELRLGGASVLVLEQSDDPVSPLKALPFGMRGLSTPTLEAFHRRGLLDGIRAAQQANDISGIAKASSHWMQKHRRPGGHFAGIPFFEDDVDASNWPYTLPSPAGVTLAVDMQSLETVLTARAIALGATIRRGVAVTDFDQTDERVIVRSKNEEFHASWLVGCDGGRSTVRKAGGFDFAGTDPELTGYSIDVELADTDVLRTGRTYTATGMYTYARPSTIAMVDFDGGACHRTQPITLDHVQSVLRRISETQVTLSALRLAATWTDRARQVVDYRLGRALLAGDAAHTHSPLGGQGLNLGLGDAMNLGWKLAATIRGDAPAGLLDSYHAERHPEGARILDWSRAQVALMRPTPSTRALSAIVRDLVETRDGATYFAGRVWGLSSNYDLGGDHPLIGRSVPDFELIDGRRIGDLMRRGDGLLLDFHGEPALRALADNGVGRMAYVCSDVFDRLGLSALLVRPDGIVAWVSSTMSPAKDVSRITARWFGSPR